VPYETATASLETAEPDSLLDTQLTECPPNRELASNPTDNTDSQQRPPRRPKKNQSYAEYRRSVYWQSYQRASEAYSLLDNVDEGTRFHRLEECGSFAWFVRDNESGRIFVESNSCGLRWCPMCAAHVRRTTTANAADWIKRIPRPKFLTLTLKHTNAPLGHQVTHLYRYFALLRKRKELLPLFRGGIWFFQIKFNDEFQQFHPHLHILLDGERTSRVLISELWLSVTGDSCVIDIRAIWDVDKAAAEVARYAATPCSLVQLDLPWAYAVVKELEGRKLCGTFGSARNVHLRQDIEHPKESRHRIAAWSTVVNLAAENKTAQMILEALRNREPIDEAVVNQFTNEFEVGMAAICLHPMTHPPPDPMLFP